MIYLEPSVAYAEAQKLARDKGAFLPFMLNMPQLFEKFVARWLNENIANEISVEISPSEPIEANFKLTLKMDNALKDKTTGALLAIIDTKYKSDDQPNEADIYQVVTYAVQMNAPKPFWCILQLRQNQEGPKSERAYAC